MNFLSVENLTKTYGDKMLFQNISFGLSHGDKVALIANNGTGKSTLLKIIMKLDDADSGKVTLRNGLRIGFLSQEPDFGENQSIRQLMEKANSRILGIVERYNKALEAQMDDFNDKTQKEFEIASAMMDDNDAWDYEHKMETILTKFRIEELDKPIVQLSGGQKKRLSLAFLLLDHPDILIMDEPTNHLDVEMIEWLEDHLIQNHITLLMVTHDRYFLDRVSNHILELENGKLYHHDGNYAYFLEKRAEREAVYDTEIDKAKNLLKKELEWMRRMPKARTTKSKARIDSFYTIEEKANSRKAKQTLKLEVKMSRVGGKIIELKHVGKKFGDKTILKDFNYSFRKGERIGIIGKNGVGKSTLLNILTGTEKIDTGEVSLGETIVFGYYSQAGIQLKDDKRVLEVVKDIADVITMANGSVITASQFLQHFMFPPNVQHTFVSKLSGGEKRRLYLLTVLIKNPNFLILDEPTNDLDLLTLNVLEDFLVNYGGCLLIVSHDRYFMDKLVDHLFVFEGDGVVRDYTGTYTEYRNEEEEKEELERMQGKEEKKAIQEAPKIEESKKKLSYKEKMEFESLEKEIADLEEEKKKIEEELSNGDFPVEEITKKAQRVGVIAEEVEVKTLRWMELSE
jgi:ATP-binding cassette subfamily F protein uup